MAEMHLTFHTWLFICYSVICGYVYCFPDICIDRLDLNGVQDLEHIVYEGSVSRDAQQGDNITLNLPILARNKTNLQDDEICGYTLYKDSAYLPFGVSLVDTYSGCATMYVDGTLDFVEDDRFEFDIAPHDCTSGRHAHREHVVIHVVSQQQERNSQLSQDSYMVEVEEGHLYEEILRLDVNYANNEVASTCTFQLVTENVPFVIEGHGILRNTAPLDYSINHNFILTVHLHQCGLDSQQADTIIINIKVTEACRVGWKGISDRIDYSPNGRVVLLGAESRLETCDVTCSEAIVSTRVHITTGHIGKGCDRDTYSIESQRKQCGATAGSVDLLPNPAISSWTRSLPTDDGQESDQVFSFDGATNAIEIPSTKFNHTLDEHFTISTWMKHDHDEEDHLAEKQHILCNADGEEMNRHHYSLFVHNCRLVFLLRQEAEGNDLNKFKPAEWRWKIPQVCDGAWHHYALSLDFPQARLYIDGKLLMDNGKSNPEVIDDWPLHPTNKIHFTKLVVGACWRGEEQSLSQYFKGYLAGLSILKGKTEKDRVIQCLNNCKESLDFHAMDEMQTGMSVTFNSEMTEITINGRNSTEVEALVRHIGYLNSRMFPTPGHRPFRVDTAVTCKDGRALNIPPLEGLVVVLQSETPTINLQGQPNIIIEEQNLQHGEPIFPDLTITATTQTFQEEEQEDVDLSETEQYQLDSCIIRSEPPMDLDVEHFRLPANLMTQHGLEASLSEQSIIITGIDYLRNYAEVLRQIQYNSRTPQDITSRLFTLTCSELNGRFVSNELRVMVDIVHEDHEVVAPEAHMEQAEMNIAHNHIQPIDTFSDLRMQEKTSYLTKDLPAASGVGMTVIIVVCVGFLLFMIVLGVIRIRAAHQRTQVVTVDGVDGEKAEMEWDNSALTIRVNPMEIEESSVYRAETELNALRNEDTDSEDDDISYQDEMDSSDEETAKVVKEADLQWDDSTLTF